MVMTIEPNGMGGLRIRQTMVRPAIYLDHWAVRHFADQEPDANRFIAALHASGGTWLFSQVNLSEFIVMRDLATARNVEALIARAFPYFYVLDTVGDTDLLSSINPNEPRFPDAPNRHWILRDLGERALIGRGHFNSTRFISDAITHGDTLLPLFKQMKEAIARSVAEKRKSMFGNRAREDFVPRKGMRLKEIFIDELLMEPEAQQGQKFKENDVSDFLHAVAGTLMCDFVLLDVAWCNKVRIATGRIRLAGIEGHLGKSYSPRNVPGFLMDLESWAAI